jgi:hypothetical protein
LQHDALSHRQTAIVDRRAHAQRHALPTSGVAREMQRVASKYNITGGPAGGHNR